MDETDLTKMAAEETRERNIVNDVIFSIKPALMIEKCFGTNRFRITNDGLLPTDAKLKILGMFITLIQVILFVAFLKLHVSNEIKLFAKMMEDIPSLITLIRFSSSAITISFLSDTNINLFTKFAKIDAMLHVNNDIYNKTRRNVLQALLTLVVYHVVISVIDLLTSEEINLGKCIVLPIYFEENLESLMFCITIGLLKCRLEVINNYLSDFMDARDKSSVFFIEETERENSNEININGNVSDIDTSILNLATVYHKIGETCWLINKVFNFQLFITLVDTMIYIITALWTSVYYYRSGELVGSSVTIVIWCITTILNIGFVSLICERLLSVRKETKVLVNEIIMDYGLSNNVRWQAKAFMDSIEVWPLRIYVYDMFSVDINLMLKYISVATTYLIVILQVSHFV